MYYVSDYLKDFTTFFHNYYIIQSSEICRGIIPIEDHMHLVHWIFSVSFQLVGIAHFPLMRLSVPSGFLADQAVHSKTSFIYKREIYKERIMSI